MKILTCKTRLLQIEKGLDYIESFKAFLPDLKRVGSNYRCPSPFKNEKTPSFFVSPTKNIWHCFSTGHGGKTIVQFIMCLNDLSFMDALVFVETRFGLNVKFYNKRIMKSCVDNLRIKKKVENYDSELKKVYENKLLDFLKTCKRKSNDKWQILDPIIEYIWDEFDNTEFPSYASFQSFLKWSSTMIKCFHRTAMIPIRHLTL